MNPIAPIVAKHTIPFAQLAQRCLNGYKGTIVQAEMWLQNHNELVQRYREQYSTWDAACDGVYGITRQAIDKRILKIHGDLSCQSATLVAECKENQAKTMGKIGDSNSEPPRVVAIQESNNNGSAGIEIVEPPKDSSGKVIPQRCLALVNRSPNELQPLLSAASKLHGFLLRLQSDDTKHDPLFEFAYEQLQIITEQSDHIYQVLKRCKPERVCPRCQGDGKDLDYHHGARKPTGKPCRSCRGLGMLAKAIWDHEIQADPWLGDSAR